METASATAIRLRRLRRENPGWSTRNSAKWKSANPVKYAAHKAVETALRLKHLERMPCERCGASELVHAHHDDYSQPLSVMWLCPTHHKERHRELGGGIYVPDCAVRTRIPGLHPERNRALQSNSSTGFKGVSGRRGKFRVTVCHKGKTYKCGTFATAIEAAMAYDERAAEIIGPTAWRNFPLKVA